LALKLLTTCNQPNQLKIYLKKKHQKNSVWFGKL